MEKIHRGIVIACTEESRPFYEDLAKTLRTPYPILFSWEGSGRRPNSHEYGAVEIGQKVFDEFVFLHCTTLVKDNSLFEKLFEIPGHVALSERFFHLMGKYVSNEIPGIPWVTNKQESIAHELKWFTAPYTVFSDPLPYISNNFEDRYGRKNMILENQYLIKYKGHWS